MRKKDGTNPGPGCRRMGGGRSGINGGPFLRHRFRSLPYRRRKIAAYREEELSGASAGDLDDAGRITPEFILKDGERRFRFVIENIPLVVYSFVPVDPPARVFMTGWVQEITGYSPADFIGDPGLIYRIIHHEDLRAVKEMLREVARYALSMEIECRIVTKTGEVRWLRNRSVPLKDETGRVSFIYGFAEDATARKKVAEALKESESRYRGIFENAVEGIFQTTPEGRFVSANPALVRMIGYNSMEEMIREVKNIGVNFYVNPEDRKDCIVRMERDGFVRGFEVACRRKDGSVIWISLNSRVVRNPDGSTAFYEGTIEDISMRKQAEQELARYREGLEKLVDLRTAELLEKEKELERKSRYLEEANTALKVLLGQREKDTREVQEAFLCNVKDLILPLLERIRKAPGDRIRNFCLDIMEKNLEAVITPFASLLKRLETRLTSQEMQVANLIKQGHSTKTIASLLRLSTRTVDCHRANIRRKLGIRNKKANLRIRLGDLN
ncbi:MAG TPA: PAS domain S-box protein [Syntrophales bacterium]|nr:PAS domain S-box protein [Syntrophales bacterium]HQN79183.1 PAS domain S-box protein [Syntrophales bacterium]HQQ28372.1 PAS domain S-box protein [Syntrophales bacterium]